MEDLLNQKLLNDLSDKSFSQVEKNKDQDESLVDNLSSNSDVPTNSISSCYTVSKALIVSCKLHGQHYIGVQTFKFRLVCKRCLEMGLNGNDFEVNPNFITEDQEFTYCRDHPNSNGSFYCNDCNHFICKVCFSDNHRNHDSNLPNYMANKFKDNLRNFISQVMKIKPEIEDSLDIILKINEEIKLLRQTTQKKLRNSIENISSENKIKTEKSINNFSPMIYAGLEDEVEIGVNRLVGMNKKITRYLNETNDMIINLNKQSNPLEICQYKKSKTFLMSDISTVITDSKNLLEFKIPSIKKSVKEKKDKIDKAIKSYIRQVSIFENSVRTSISSGITNKSIILRRFIKYNKRKELVCFKLTSLIMKVDSPIFLVGFSLCGLYVSSKTLYQSDANLFTSVSDRNQIPIMIKVSEVKDQVEVENNISDEQILYGVLDINDPTNQIYLKKAVYIKPNTDYLINILNLDKNIYIDVWSGKVAKIFLKEMNQHLTCNCTKVNFIFSCADGFESDLDEFNFGIIANVIYSQVFS